MSSVALRILGVALAAALSISAHAGVIFESAQSGPTGQDSGGFLGVTDSFFVAVNFEVTETVETGAIGGHFYDCCSDTPIFGAIVRLAGWWDYAQPEDLDSVRLLGATLITPPDPSDNVSGNLRVRLEPGWYALVFGSGHFGATGETGAILNNEPDGVSQVYSVRVSDGAVIFQQDGARLFVDTRPTPEYSILVDTSMTPPGSSLPFTSFGMPLLDNHEAVFWARNDTASGLYRLSNGVLTTIADTTTASPTGDLFLAFDTDVAFCGEFVAFGARTSAGDGLYVSTPSGIELILDESMPAPGPQAEVYRISQPTTDGCTVGFCVVTQDYEYRVCAWREGEPLRLIADESTLLPNAPYAFDWIYLWSLAMSDDRVVFTGGNAAEGVCGVYAAGDAGVELVYDGLTIPGGYATEVYAGVVAREGRLAVGAVTSDFMHYAFYSDANGAPGMVAAWNTAPPGEPDGRFSVVAWPAFNGRHVTFDAQTASGVCAIYTELPGELTRMLAAGDVIAGRTVSSWPHVHKRGFENNTLTFNTYFDDGSRAIVEARYPAAPGDADEDGDVDLADLALVAQCYDGGAGASCGGADFNGDTNVAWSDVLRWFECGAGPDVFSPCDY